MKKIGMQRDTLHQILTILLSPILVRLKFFWRTTALIKFSQKTLDVELTRDVLNIEMEREYELNNNWRCIVRHLDFKSFNIKNPSFKIRYFYSMARLNTLVSEDYQAIEYPVQEHFQYGLFKDRIEKLGDNFDPTRPQETYYLNRFNPGQDSAPRNIDFYLSTTFNRPENIYLRNATHLAVARVNRSLKEAQANIQINLVHTDSKSKAEEKRSGDLRYNTIILIDEPLSNGLLGYGPSVSNPRTGEILQAHTNMYSGVLKSIVRRAYLAMVRFSKKQTQEAPRAARQKKAASAAIGEVHTHLGHLQMPETPLSPVTAKSSINLQAFQELPPPRWEKSKAFHQGIHHHHLEGEGGWPSPTDFQDFIEIHSKNNAYHVEMVNFHGLAQELIPGITQIPGIMTDDGQLKPWEELSKKQRAQVSKIVVVNLYTAILVHELGHNLGLRHNFMGSTDADNFYSDEEAQDLGLWNSPKSSSIMDYMPSGLTQLATFGKYDIATLRYAYRQEVELSDSGEIVPVTTSLKDLEAKLATEDKKIKQYRFCTDEQAGLSALCGRFDEGTTLKEIATFHTKSYLDNYEERNWRNGRLNFTTFQLPIYILRNMRQFIAMRKIYEVFERFAGIYGAPFMEQGCTPELLAQLPPEWCASIGDIRDATLIVGNFFLDILKTPNLTCAVTHAGGQKNKTADFLALEDIYEAMKWRGPTDDIPTSCFDTAIQDYLADPSNHLQKSFKVKGETGKYLNSIKDPNPRFPLVSDIAVRGIWSDKLLAMKYLSLRNDELIFSDKDKGSLADIGNIGTSLNNFFDHIITRNKLNAPIKFRMADGSEYVEDHFELIGTSYKVDENPHPFIAPFFGLPRPGRGALNQALVANAIWYNRTDDLDKRPLSESFKDDLSIFKTRRTTMILHPQEQNALPFDKHIYVAEEENRIALILVNAKKALEKLADVSKEVAQQVLIARTTPPENTDKDTAIVLENFTANQITNFARYLESIHDIPPAEAMTPPLDSVVRLGVEGLHNALNLLQEMSTAPEGVSPEVQAAYDSDLDDLSEFINNDLQKRVEDIEQSIKLLYSE